MVVVLSITQCLSLDPPEIEETTTCKIISIVFLYPCIINPPIKVYIIFKSARSGERRLMYLIHIRMVEWGLKLLEMRDDCIYRTMHAGNQFKRSRLNQKQQNSTRANQNLDQSTAMDVHWRLAIPVMCMGHIKEGTYSKLQCQQQQQQYVNLF